MRTKVQIVAGLIATLGCVPGFASISVTQNISPGATSWPSGALLQVGSNPSSQLTVGENFGSGVTSIGETFTTPTGSNYLLQTVYLYVGVGTGTSATAPLMVNLYDQGGQVAPNPATYNTASNLLGSGNGVSIAYTPQTAGLVRLDFTGSDQVVLVAGHMYAFELAGTSSTSPVLWYRTISDLYSGGAAYRNHGYINGTNARDFGLAVFGTSTNQAGAPRLGTINGAVLHQMIDGYGAGVAFLDAGLDPLSDAQMDTLYGTGSNQMGLNLLRVRIDPTGAWTTAAIDGQKVSQRGGRVLATPWTPPASMKSNNNVVGGSLLPSFYGAYAQYLNSFASFMASSGAPVSVVSLQNEPDATVTYESATWTAAQFDTFLSGYGSLITTPIMMPESESFVHSLSDTSLNDPAASKYIAYIGGHLYGASVQDYPLARAMNKPIWMTEYLVNDQTIGAAVGTAAQISDAMTIGNMSAYIWWKTIGDANGLLNAAGVAQPRAYVMAQFSKFVHPGDYRIDVPLNASPLGLSSYKDPVSGRFTIVVVNNTTVAETETFTLNGVSVASLTPYMTSATQSLAQQASVPVSAGRFAYTFPLYSVTTFTGTESVTAGTVQLTTTASLSKLTDGSFTATLTTTNSGTGTAANVSVSSGVLGAATASNAPQPMANLCPGCSNSVTLAFPASAGASASNVIGHYTGTYDGGTFGASFRSQLP